MSSDLIPQHEYDTEEQGALARLGQRLESAVRGGVAWGGGLGILGYYASRIYATTLMRFPYKPWQGDDPVCRELPGRFAKAADAWIKRVLQTRVEIHDSVPEVDPEERLIYMGNHPSTNAVFMVVSYLAQRFASRIGSITKKENLRHPVMAPLIGFPGVLSGSLASIDRADTDSAIASIRQACTTVLRPGTGLVYFPDAHRPKPKAIKKSREKWAPKIPGVAAWLRETCFPYSGGIQTLLAGTAHVPRRVINVTAGFNRPDRTVFDLPRLHKATLHMEVDDVTQEIPTDEGDLREWLMKEWQRKNELLGGWKAPNPG